MCDHPATPRCSDRCDFLKLSLCLWEKNFGRVSAAESALDCVEARSAKEILQWNSAHWKVTDIKLAIKNSGLSQIWIKDKTREKLNLARSAFPCTRAMFIVAFANAMQVHVAFFFLGSLFPIRCGSSFETWFSKGGNYHLHLNNLCQHSPCICARAIGSSISWRNDVKLFCLRCPSACHHFQFHGATIKPTLCVQIAWCPGTDSCTNDWQFASLAHYPILFWTWHCSVVGRC